MPLADGHIGICRVLRHSVESGEASALVAASDWISDAPPALDDPAVRRILILRHHCWNGASEMHWVSDAPPKEFRVLGQIEVLPEDHEIVCHSYSGWKSLALQVLMQWRWDHDREAVEMEDRKKNEADAARQTIVGQKREEYLSRISLPELLSKDLLSSWKRYPAPAERKACLEIFQQFIRALMDVEPTLTRERVSQELQTCVENLNRLDAERNHFIETGERERLCDILEEILHAAKFPELVESIDEWRDW